MPAAIHLSSVNKKFGPVEVLHQISLEVQYGEVVAICGPSGAGKTTLLQIMGTLESPDSGEVEVLGTAVHTLSDRKLARFRNTHLGFVFQFHRLLPEFTALENVTLPAWIAEGRTSPQNNRAMELLDHLGVAHCADKKPGQMSGGENQRVAVARALMNRPSIILADEPSGSLDTDNAEHLHDLFVQLRDELKLTFVIVTHNRELARRSDRIIAMEDGGLVHAHA